jgi:HAMP domain-containing protein
MNATHSLPRTSEIRSYAIRRYLLILVAVVVVPMLVLTVVLAWGYGISSRRAIEAERSDAVTDLIQLLDREVRAVAETLETLSLSRSALDGSPVSLQRAIDAAPGKYLKTIVVFDPSGNVRAAAPSENPYVPLATADNIRIAEIVASRQIHISPLLASDTTKPGLFFVSIPVVVDNEVVAVVAGGVSPGIVQGLFAKAGLHAGWTGVVVDRRAIVVARSRDFDKYAGVPAQTELTHIVQTLQSVGEFDVIDRDGVEVRNSFRRSAFSGLTAAIAIPVKILDAPLWNIALTMSLIGLGLALLSLVLGLLVAGQIERAVHQLGYVAVALAAGDVVPVPTNPVQELEQVSRALEKMAAESRHND